MRAIIFGGTGTLGREIVNQLYNNAEITIFSRDECKQQAMAKTWPKCRYVIGDIRNPESIERALHTRAFDVAFHVAAIKHVDVAEANQEETVLTNVNGTFNVANACRANCVSNVVFSSTDKAVDPINVYGMTKAIGERFFLAQEYAMTKFSVYRWGNVLGSRGSVVHTFARTLKADNSVPITHGDMTRFWIHIEDACWFMLSTYKSAPVNRVQFPAMKTASVVNLARATAAHLGIDKFEIEEIGLRPGEKIHECIDRQAGIYSNTAPAYSDMELREMVARVL